VRHVEAFLGMPAPDPTDPRWSFELAGGSTMDLGCYSLSALTLLAHHLGGPPRIVSGRAHERAGSPGVDERLSVDVKFPSGATGTAGSDMDATSWDFHLTVTGSHGKIHLPDFPRPHEDDSLELRRPDRVQVERLGSRSSYTYQLEAFAAAVRHGSPVTTDANFAVTVMELIDAAYAASGLPRRQSVRQEARRP
jgi:predicted dehydrogenase